MHFQTVARDLAAHCARVLLLIPALLSQRAQGMPGARCARSRACSVVNTRVSHHGHTGTTRHSPRNGFNGCFSLSPVTGLVCHPPPSPACSSSPCPHLPAPTPPHL